MKNFSRDMIETDENFSCEKMKIAFATEENKGIESMLAYHFGRCPYYVFVDVSGGR